MTYVVILEPQLRNRESTRNRLSLRICLIRLFVTAAATDGCHVNEGCQSKNVIDRDRLWYRALARDAIDRGGRAKPCVGCTHRQQSASPRLKPGESST